MEPVTGEDGVVRCLWAGGPGPMRDYHDREWGVPVHGEAAYLERLTLEAFQSGLSWSTILAKRPAFRTAFHDFDAEAIAETQALTRRYARRQVSWFKRYPQLEWYDAPVDAERLLSD